MNEISLPLGTVEKYSQQDFRIFNDIIEETPMSFWDNKIQYNQNLIHPNSCFIHWPIGAISDLFGYKWKPWEIKEMVEYSWTTEWADPSWWWYFADAVKYVSKQAILKGLNVIYYRMPAKDYLELLKRWYSVITGFNVSKEWFSDKQDDWILNHSWGKYWKPSNWHCIRLTQKEGKIYAIDNYLNKNWYTNIYQIQDIQWMVDDWTFFQCWYIYCHYQSWVLDWYQGMTLAQKIAKLKARSK